MRIDHTRKIITAADLVASPLWYPLSCAAGQTTVVRLTEADYRAASFLDERLLKAHPVTESSPVTTLEEAANSLMPEANYVFHVGHVGSTLVSRLVGEHAGVFSVREPMLLRTLAGGEHTLSLRATVALLSRTWRPEQRAVIKASSFVSEIAPRLLGAGADSRAMLMFASAGTYLRCILGGPNSRVEARILGAGRLQRLRRRFPGVAPALAPQSEGEWIAMGWLSEMSALEAAAHSFPARTHWVDFDRFLTAPAAELGVIMRSLGAHVTPKEVETLACSPLLSQYSKAPEFPYDATLRREVLQSAEKQHGAEIELGTAWLDRAARAHPSLAAIMDRGGSAVAPLPRARPS